jgi:periplasmic protein TonB
MLKFTIWHGFAVSLALHSALAAPFMMYRLQPPSDDVSTLVIELKGVAADAQAEEKIAEQAPEPAQQQAAAPPPEQAPPRQAPPPPQEQEGAKPPEVQPQPPSPQREAVAQETQPVPVPHEQQKPQTLKTDPDLEADRLNEYVKRLSKKVQSSLVYPDEGRKTGLQGNAKVSFTIGGDGQIKPGTLTLVVSSGQPKLDESALATARGCAPFEPPPREITIAVDVRYGRKK